MPLEGQGRGISALSREHWGACKRHFLGIKVFEFGFEPGGCVEQGLSWSVLLIHVTRERAPACSTGIERGGEILWENVTLAVNIPGGSLAP